MTAPEFDRYLTLLCQLLRVRGRQRDTLAGELRSHLEECVEDLMAAGLDRAAATEQALAEFGDAAALAASLAPVLREQKRRWQMRTGFWGLSAVVATLFVTAVFWPTPQQGDGGRSAIADEPFEADASLQPDATFAPTRPATADARSEHKLREISRVDLDEIPLGEAVQVLGDQHELQFYLDLRSLEHVGIGTDTVVSISLSDISVGLILELMLRELDLTYTIREGLVIVTTQEEVEQQLVTRVYPVGDLTGQASLPRHRPASPFREEEEPGGGRFGLHAPHELEQLAALIMSTQHPGSWSENGGTGSLRRYRSHLVISQTDEVHRRVRQLLDDLRAAERGQETAYPVPRHRGDIRQPYRDAPSYRAQTATPPSDESPFDEPPTTSDEGIGGADPFEGDAAEEYEPEESAGPFDP